jgi:hypothetical protein
MRLLENKVGKREPPTHKRGDPVEQPSLNAAIHQPKIIRDETIWVAGKKSGEK